uniref:Ankyrin repeat domain-containing protein SOWAHB n=1 Tax=Ceratitis capitata TaxID=7213 RepID=W8B4H7_CERCA
MATTPTELSIAEIRNYMLNNDSKVTNHALVKHFKHFLTKPDTQNEARKLFKVYVNVLSTIKNENNQKYLILRKKYINELPPDDVVQRAMAAAGTTTVPGSPGGISLLSESAIVSPVRQPPPYVPPPEVTTPNKECVCADEEVEVATVTVTSATAKAALAEHEKTALAKKNPEDGHELEVEQRLKAITKESHQENKENIPRFSFSSGGSATSLSSKTSKDTIDSDVDPPGNNVSVKEATRIYNRLVSEEEAKAAAVSPSTKKRPEEKEEQEEKEIPEVTLAHKKAKEWIVAMARANYQDLSKLAKEYPELVKLHDPFTGYTALHWAAKHGNQDVVKLIAGTYKADVNARTNGGYTPLHISMQFGRADVFELLVNVYKANRDLTDWSGNKPLDYSKQSTSVSPSTFNKIQAMRQQVIEGGLVSASGTLNSWRNQGKEKNGSRKRFGIPSDWFFECPSEEDNRSVQQLLGSGKWSHTLPSGSSKSPSPAVSPTPSARSSSSSCRWYDTESDDEDQTLRN